MRKYLRGRSNKNPLGLLREPGHAVEADDLERAVRLVQMGLAVLELRRVGGVGLILRQGVARAPERLLDLAMTQVNGPMSNSIALMRFS